MRMRHARSFVEAYTAIVYPKYIWGLATGIRADEAEMICSRDDEWEEHRC